MSKKACRFMQRKTTRLINTKLRTQEITARTIDDEMFTISRRIIREQRRLATRPEGMAGNNAKIAVIHRLAETYNALAKLRADGHKYRPGMRSNPNRKGN